MKKSELIAFQMRVFICTTKTKNFTVVKVNCIKKGFGRAIAK